MTDLLYLFVSSLFISLVSFGGGAQALFYQTGVTQTHWLNNNDLSAVLAFGYATPGPAIFGTATFIGYHLDGLFGAIVGSIGIFIMPFLLALLAAKYLSKLLENAHAQQFVKGVGLAAAGIVAATALLILQPQHLPIWGILIAATSFVLVIFRKRTNPLLILTVGGLLGVFFG
jgi:chromate transporter